MENNQKNTNNGQQVQTNVNSSNSKLLIILMALIIAGLLGYIVYTNFIQKSDNSEPKSNNIQENENNNQKPVDSAMSKNVVETSLEKYDVTQKVVYKSKDDKNELIIEPSGEKFYAYYAYFNGKKINVSMLFKLGKYILVGGDDEIGPATQCGEYTYIVDLETNMLVDLYTNNLLRIIKVNDNYYFEEYICAMGDVAIYDEQLNKIGSSYIGADNNYFYIFDKNVVKYDFNGKEVARTNDSFEVESNDRKHINSQAFNGTLYILVSDKNYVYLVDTSELKSTIIGTSSEYAFGEYSFSYESASTHNENEKITLELYDLNNSRQTINMYYDIATKQLTK